jgi:type VI protein secretion system component Hcp
MAVALADEVFLKLPGIAGSSIQEPYKDWIGIRTYTFEITTELGREAHQRILGPKKDKPDLHTQISELTLTKNVDCASPLLMQYSSQMHEFPEALLVLTASDGKEHRKYLSFKLTRARIKSFVFDLGPDLIPSETIVLSVDAVEMSTFQMGVLQGKAEIRNQVVA